MHLNIQKALMIIVYSMAGSYLCALCAFIYFHIYWVVPSILYIPVYIGSLGIFLSLGAAFFVKNRVIYKLQRITAFAQKIALGNLSIRLEVTSDINDLDKLAIAFNEVVVYADTLTQELEQRVYERTKEMNEKIKELEKWQKATVNREQKMMALKQELKESKNNIIQEVAKDTLNITEVT